MILSLEVLINAIEKYTFFHTLTSLIEYFIKKKKKKISTHLYKLKRKSFICPHKPRRGGWGWVWVWEGVLFCSFRIFLLENVEPKESISRQ